MQFPENPPIGHQEVNPNTGAIYEWNGSTWVNVPGEGSGVTDDDIARMVADQNRQDLALQQETTERMERDMLERSERTSGDKALQDQIDALEPYDDSALVADQQRQDKALQEYQIQISVEQQEQDERLTLFKGEISKEQAAQDKALKAEQDARAERDALHDSQLATIEYKLDVLAKIQFRGDYVFKHDTDCDAAYAACMAAAAGDVAAGQQCGRDMLACENGKVSSGTFEAVDPDDRFDHLEAIVIHQNAIDGEEVKWDAILKAGDYLEIDHRGTDGLDKQNYGLYRLTADPVEATNAAGEPVFDMQLEFLQGEGVLAVNERYECRGIEQATGVNPEELGDFLLKDDAANTYALKGHNHDSDYITKEADNSTYKDWLLLADGRKKSPTSYAGGNHAHGWTDITGKPATYAPAPHSHDYAGKDHTHGWTQITGKPTTFPPSSHTHNYASSNHTHSGYASSSHTHSGYASSSHNHNSSYVKGNYTISKSNGNFYIS